MKNGNKNNGYIIDELETPVGKIPVLSTKLTLSDISGTVKSRFTFGRMNYRVPPELYAAGRPGPGSAVLVSANYKMSFDALREHLTATDAWLLVLDTKGINVWCAAGKGTFGTDELVNRINQTRLQEIVSHRRLICPQLGAPGVAAHEVRKATGFTVVYGPVRASDIPAFIQNGLTATDKMRQVEFTLTDRAKLVPAELVTGGRYLLYVMAAFFALSGFDKNGYSTAGLTRAGIPALANLLLAFSAGTVIAPLLLPVLPGRSFALKGCWTGLLAFGAAYCLNLAGPGLLDITAWCLLMVSLSSFLTLNFTGASTYTSLSGVAREMKTALPLQISCAGAGAVIWLADRFI